MGRMLLARTAAGDLVASAFLLPGATEELWLERLARAVSPRVLRQPAALDEVRRELSAYLAGERRTFDLRVDLALATPFQRVVLTGLRESVPYGERTTYGALARQHRATQRVPGGGRGPGRQPAVRGAAVPPGGGLLGGADRVRRWARRQGAPARPRVRLTPTSATSAPGPGQPRGAPSDRERRRDDTLAVQPREQVQEAGQGGAVGREPGGTAARHVGEALDVASQVAVRVPPRGDAPDVLLPQSFALGQSGPHRLRPHHLLLQGSGRTLEADRLDPQGLGQARPHPAPAEDIAVGDVEGQVARSRSGGRPVHLLGQDAGVGHVGQRVPLRPGAGEHERPAGLAADGRLDGERLAHVHGVADGVADDGVRAVHAPGEPVPFGRLPELVLLGVVEVRVGQARLVLVERGVRHVTGAVRLERPQVVLEAGDEGDVLHRPGRPHRRQDVAHDAAVDLDVLGLGGLARPGGDEHVRRRVAPQGGGQRGGVGEVGQHRRHAGQLDGEPGGTARERSSRGEGAPRTGHDRRCRWLPRRGRSGKRRGLRSSRQR